MKRIWVSGIILIVAARLAVRAQDVQVLAEDLSTYWLVTQRSGVYV